MSSSMGLSILAGGLAFVGSASAVDLVVNGSFEDASGWTGTFGTYNYSAVYWAGPPVPASENPGELYSWRHAGNAGFSEPLSQTVDLTLGASAVDIDANRGTYTFSAWMASYTQNLERPYVTVQFFDASGTTQVGSTVVHDRTSSLNFVRFADGVTTFDRTTHEHNWAKYVRNGSIPAGARFAKVGVTRSPNAGLNGNPDTYTDLVKLDVAVASVPPGIDSAQPTGNGVRPEAAVTIVLQDGSSQVNTNSIQFSFDAALVSPSITKTGAVTTVFYDPPGLLASGSAHTYRIVFADNGSPVTLQTNQFSFSVLSYYNILLPAPIHLETFESTAEGSLPVGWTNLSYFSVPSSSGCDPMAPDIGGLQDLGSSCYESWVAVDSARFNNSMLTYDSHTPETDYQRVLSVNAANMVNGVFVDHLAQGKILFGNSGYHSANGSQIVYLFSEDFDLSGHNNVYLSYHSLWEQNQDSIGAVEYSIDEGATWLPVVYMLDAPDIIRAGDGSIDAAATLSTLHTSDSFEAVATYVDPADSQIKGGYYGAFIGVESNLWSTLGNFISARDDDNPVESKRVEIFRLPAADNQPKVRLRFAHAGTDSWYFGIDNVGFYSITSVAPPSLTGPSSVTDYYGNTVSFNVSPQGIGPFTYQWRRDGSILTGQTNSSLSISNAQSADALAYDVIVGYPGGSSTSTPAVLTLVASGAYVVGQWDFDSFDLAASCGRALDYFDFPSQINTFFGPSDGFGLPQLDGQSVNVMNFPGKPPEGPMAGYKMFHGIPGNGGGTNVNQYTLIFDILYPDSSQNLRRALLQTDPDNSDATADFRIDESNRIGVDGVYQGTVQSNHWHRIGLAVDLSGPGPSPTVAKFIDGVKVGQQTLSAGRDGRWSLSADPANPWALLFAGGDLEVQPGYVSSIQLRSGRLSDAEFVRLGGPSAAKIPGCIRITRESGTVVVRWSGGVVLQTATAITGPWVDVPTATSPYTPTGALDSLRFYRPKP